VAAAAGSRRAAAARAAAHPGALAEEMEAFAVGLAARLARRSLTVLRGISNVAGDRRTTRWQTAEALAAVRTLLVQTLHDVATPNTPKVIAP
jgi:nucleoside phosphorylase